jgi:hypothetical protein
MSSNGSRDLAIVAARLRASGDRGLRLQALRGLRASTAPFVAAARANARERLPRGGGLNELAATQKIAPVVRMGGRNPSVRVRSADGLRNATNAGWIRHKTFGEWRKNTPTQRIPGARGWWDDAVKSAAPQARAQMEAAMRAVMYEIVTRV